MCCEFLMRKAVLVLTLKLVEKYNQVLSRSEKRASIENYYHGPCTQLPVMCLVSLIIVTAVLTPQSFFLCGTRN